MTTDLPSLLAAALHLDGGLPDGELLGRFVAARDEVAFAALLRRHGPMVMGVCRRVLRNEADAEDAFQAVFIVLARRADSVRPPGMVGHWLYGVAFNTARKARAVAARWRERERSAVTLPRRQLPDDPALELLDEELRRLPERYRAPIVLCDLEGRTIREAAEAFDCPPGTVATRLTRGRALLAKRLTRRGLATTGGVTTLLNQAVASAPPAPAELAGRLASSSPAATALAEGVIRSMRSYRLKLAFAVVSTVALAGLAFAAGGLLDRARRPLPGPAASAEPVLAPAPKERTKDPTAELKKLHGSWRLSDVRVAGRGTASFQLLDYTFRPDGKVKVVIQPHGDSPRGELKYEYAIDPTKSPKWITLSSGKTVHYGIYKIEDNKLTITMTRFGATEKDRPTDFATEGTNHQWQLCERVTGK